MVNKVSSFLMTVQSGGTGTRSFPNALEGADGVTRMFLPTNKDVLIKNIRFGTFIVNAAQTGNSLGEAASGSFFFTGRFFLLSNNDFIRNEKGVVVKPPTLPAPAGFVNLVPTDTLEYSVNYSSPNQMDLNIIGNGIQMTQLGYSIPVYGGITQSLSFIVSIEYQDLC